MVNKKLSDDKRVGKLSKLILSTYQPTLAGYGNLAKNILNGKKGDLQMADSSYLALPKGCQYEQDLGRIAYPASTFDEETQAKMKEHNYKGSEVEDVLMLVNLFGTKICSKCDEKSCEARKAEYISEDQE
ncbi:MAG: hypothetical protein GOV02_03515 [Candidatus Aenigmarchaeota archaeon]|nr:hypothetical protein [Candidatus Aenigmarchaeota archaeon]